MLGLRLLHYTHVIVLLQLWFRRSTSATFAGSENRGRHRVSYVCEYYEVLHVWHYNHPGAQHGQGAVNLDRLHQPRLRERFPRNRLHPEVYYFRTTFRYGNTVARSWVMLLFAK